MEPIARRATKSDEDATCSIYKCNNPSVVVIRGGVGCHFCGNQINLCDEHYQHTVSDLSRIQSNPELLAILKDAELACDAWEEKNGDAPHRTVKLGDRIRVNAGLLDH